jgi:tetratricopeptide (TPR) repeat protein
MALAELVFVLALQGKLAEAERTCARARREKAPAWAAVVLAYMGSIVHRGQGRFDEAHALLAELKDMVREQGGHADETLRDADTYAADMLVGAGRFREAREALAKAEGASRHSLYAPLALENDYAAAVSVLRAAYRSGRGAVRDQALLAIVAAIVAELGGDGDLAAKIRSEIARRFPESRVHAVAAAADRLLVGGRADGLEALACEPFWRSELFYWAGRLFEKQGNKKEARRLMRLAVKEDPTRRWPAELARAWPGNK